MTRKLIDYLPPVIRDVREYKAILNGGEQAEVAALWETVDAAFNDQFVATATLNGVKRWEAILGIKAKGADSLETRKFRIFSRLNEQLPYTLPVLERMLQTLCGEKGYSVEVQSENYMLIVRIALASKSNFEDVGILLNKVAPANMVIDLSLKYNQHSLLAQYPHAQLARYTHAQLRNEVMN